MNKTKKSKNIIIIGGSIIGSSIAYFLAAQPHLIGSILVVEKDPSYAKCSTSLSVGGVRQQFSTPENIKIAKFSAGFIKSVDKYLSVDGISPEIDFNEAGYLFLATEDGKKILQQNVALQKSLNTDVVLLSLAEIQARFSWLNTSDLAGGALGLKNEGWIDPYSLLMAFKQKAESLGVKYVIDEVIGMQIMDKKVTAVKLEKAGKIECDCIVNAAGPKATTIARMAGIKNLPVRSRKRFVYTFECRHPIPSCPLVIDPTGVYFRPEGTKFVCGVSPPQDQDPDCEDFIVEYELFEETIWPALAHRVPTFDSIKPGYAWAGHYAYNILDQNAILGPHPEIANFYFANGFSGHGAQQSPAVGRAISELITFGSYQTLDLTAFGFERFATGALIQEKNVI